MIITLAPSPMSYSTDPTAHALRSVQAGCRPEAGRRDDQAQTAAPARLHISRHVALADHQSPAPCHKVWRPTALAKALTICVPLSLAVALFAGFM